MITQTGNLFLLHTAHTTYAFRVMPTGHLEHLYYGRKIHGESAETLFPDKNTCPLGNVLSYSKEHFSLSMENTCLEVSGVGKGDLREPFARIELPDGSTTNDFLFQKAELLPDKKPLETMPCAYSETKTPTLEVTLRDDNSGVHLVLCYTVYEECDVITRSVRVENVTKEEVKLHSIKSLQLDLDRHGMFLHHFQGSWTREMNHVSTPVSMAKLTVSSNCGNSSNRSNPFVMLSASDTTEDYGDCYGCNLIYSGNHATTVEENSFGKTRLSMGINPDTFCYVLAPGEAFEAPEAVMTYSHNGFTGQSLQMHDFVRNHIVRGVWAKKARPVLLNSWEAAYFDIKEDKLVRMAKAAAQVGIELFVMDDGWFGRRDDDSSSLGDWTPNAKKLPGGVKRLAEKINALGLEFGIWVEPEMVNENSDLFRAHPDWILGIPGQKQSPGRNQLLLDLTRAEVREYIIEAMTRIFSDGNIAYVKWDMNRIFSDVYSLALPAGRQGEVAHRYVLGLYEIMDTLVKRFPNILFEGCSAGGNRFDLGILCYMPQIWASDDSDALERERIQTGYSYGYPPSTWTAHVSSCPNHQTLRMTPLETRFQVALFGVLGYEFNLLELSTEELMAVKAQIALYKKYRETLQYGDYYRIETDKRDTLTKGSYQWMTVAKDKHEALAFYGIDRAVPNYGEGRFVTKGLAEDAKYHFTNRVMKYDVRLFGDLINMVAPIHVKKDSLVHNVIARFVKMDGEIEDYTAYGDDLNFGGVKLHSKFYGCGYNETTGYFQDAGSRLYLIEQVDSE